MRVLIVSQYFWPENFRINDLTEELRARGCEVSVLTGWPNYPSGSIFPEFRSNPQDYADYKGIRIYRVPLIARGSGALRLILNYFSFAFLASIIGPILLAGKKFDHIFVYEPSPVTVGIPAIVLKYIKKASLVFWVLDLWPETLVAVGAVKSRNMISAVGGLVSFIYKHCNLVLAQSRAFVDAIGNYCPQRDKIRYFPSWAEEIFVGAEVSPSQEVLEASGGAFSIMFAGNIGEAQDFPAILDAAERLKDDPGIRWLIVGDGRNAAWVKEQCLTRGLSDNVILLGRHPIENMPSFYAAADALLVSLQDKEVFSATIPGKVQTYLAAGKPIVGMLNGEGAKVILESGAGLVCKAGDGEGLAGVVKELVSRSEGEREAMGAAGQDYYHSQFGRTMLMDRLTGWFSELQHNINR